MILITSAAYVDQELRSEFGALPPAFLPAGNRRLYEHQLRALPAGEPVYLSIPADFELDTADQRALAAANVGVIPVPVGLSLADSLIYSINFVGEYAQPLRILHGDTLIDGLDDRCDLLSVARSSDFYNWRIDTHEAEADSVWAGYFSFASPPLFLRCLTRAQRSFVDAVDLYDRERALAKVVPTRWLDFGHVNTYSRSRGQISTARAFNDVGGDGDTIVKTSANAKKILAEAHWFASVPPAVARFTPRVLGSESHKDGAAYRLEYLHLTPLNELFVFGRQPEYVWRQIFRGCKRFLATCAETPAVDSTRGDLILAKTTKRLDQFAAQRGFALDQHWHLNGRELPSLIEIAQISAGRIRPGTNGCVLHGDFCLSNIFYDFRSQQVKVIDPRGLDADDQPSIYGDPRYDLAKLAHSVVGGYDQIIAGYQTAVIAGRNIAFAPYADARIDTIRNAFWQELTENDTALREDILQIMIHLFLSMLPLHADRPERQDAMLATALHLFDSTR